MRKKVEDALELRLKVADNIEDWFENEYKPNTPKYTVDMWDKVLIEANAQIKLLRFLLDDK